MAETIAVIDVVVPAVPVVAVASVGVQGPPGEPGPAGPAGPQGEPGEGAGLHAPTHYAAGADPVDLMGLGGFPNLSTVWLRGDRNWSSIPAQAPALHAATHAAGGADALTGTLALTALTTTQSVAIGATPAQSGALRLGNGGEISARNAANNADIRGLAIDANNDVIVGSTAGYNTQVHGGSQVSMTVGPNTLACAGTYFTPVPDGTISLGLASNRWSACHVSGSVAVGTNPAATGAIRLANAQGIVGRVAADNADRELLTFTSGNQIQIGPTTPAGTITINGVLNPKLYMQLAETTAPPTPPTNGAYLWLQDNGSGKTQLMVQFNTGIAIQLAIQL